MDDRRRDVPRKGWGLPVRYCVIPDDTPREGRTVNISPRGMFIKTDHSEEQGRPVKIEVELPGWDALQIRGEVVWVQQVPTHFRNEIDNGFGIWIRQAPERWFWLFTIHG